MNLLVIFGSSSDQHIFEPISSHLSNHHTVITKILSAHRNPVELDDLLKNTTFDLIIAGAGLAAHLPGVIASKVNTPVIGIPVKSALAGLDATLSIVQMPFGVPVLTCGPDKYNEVLNFINLSENKRPDLKKININLVINSMLDISNYKKEIDRTIDYAQENKIELKIANNYESDQLNIILVTTLKDIKKDSFSIHVPLLDQNKINDPKSALILLEWLSFGGLWVGVNNTRNAIKFFEKLFLRS